MDTLSAATTSLREMDPGEIAAAVGSRGLSFRATTVISIERNARSASAEMGDQLRPKRVISFDRNR
jgi:hypothetical protein